MTGKKVHFSAIVKVVTPDGEVRFERGPGPVIVNDFLDQVESLDLLQHYLREQLASLRRDDDEDLDSLEQCTIPLFQCVDDAMDRLASPKAPSNPLDYLKLLSQSQERPSPQQMVEFASKRKTRKDRRAGAAQQKAIPGRGTPEQRKQRLMVSNNDSTASDKNSNSDTKKGKTKKNASENSKSEKPSRPMPVDLPRNIEIIEEIRDPAPNDHHYRSPVAASRSQSTDEDTRGSHRSPKYEGREDSTSERREAPPSPNAARPFQDQNRNPRLDPPSSRHCVGKKEFRRIASRKPDPCAIHASERIPADSNRAHRENIPNE